MSMMEQFQTQTMAPQGTDSSFNKFSWLFSKLRMKSSDADILTGYQQFHTPKFMWMPIQPQSHDDFLADIVTGVSEADLFLLVVDSIESFESKYFNVNGDLSIDSVTATSKFKNVPTVVCLNKMDKYNYSEAHFSEMKGWITCRLESAGFSLDHIHCIPTSGCLGENFLTPSSFMTWYKGTTLLEILETAI